MLVQFNKFGLKILFYYGPGVRFNNYGGYDESIGGRGVFGLAWFPRATSIDVFLELVQLLQLSPATGFGIDAGLGFMYFFYLPVIALLYLVLLLTQRI